jgi:1,4-dihydroxy-2-naphthoate octaprenyltransferase
MKSVVRLSVWWRSLRAYSLPLTILPVLCAFLYARARGINMQWNLLPLMLGSGVLLHAGTNLLNDYYDYTLGFDTSEASGSSGVIQEKLIPANTILFHGRLYIALGCLFGLPLVFVRGLPLLLIGIISACGAYFYSHPKGYKYKGVGEPAVFALMGPLLFTAATYAATGTFPPDSLIPACALGGLVTAVLLVNNIRDEQMDRNAGFITLPMRLGPTASHAFFIGLVSLALLIPPLLFFTGLLKAPALLPLLSLPLALRLERRVATAQCPAEDLKTGPLQTARLYMLYATLFALALFFCA